LNSCHIELSETEISVAWAWRLGMGVVGVLSALLLVYASIIPLHYTPLPWEETFQRWKSIPWLNLGIYSRADWIANGLIVVPISFLLTGSMAYRCSNRLLVRILIGLGAAGLVVSSLIGLIVAIELLQVWFPPRTVSWNDIVSGWVGALTGSCLWIAVGQRLVDFLRQLFGISGFEERLLAVSFFGCLAALFYSVYPLDLVLSVNEWQEKIRLGRVQWGLVPQYLGTFEWVQGLVVSAIRMVPFGIAALYFRSKSSRWLWVLLMGMLLEVLQLPFFSKYSTPSDVIAGWCGGALALSLVSSNRLFALLDRSPWGWIALAWSIILGVAFLGRFERWVVDAAELQQRWADFFTYPLLRYYYTSEYSALTNLAGKILSFNVLGGLIACFFIK